MCKLTIFSSRATMHLNSGRKSWLQAQYSLHEFHTDNITILFIENGDMGEYVVNQQNE
jgi:hypothetical protein